MVIYVRPVLQHFNSPEVLKRYSLQKGGDVLGLPLVCLVLDTAPINTVPKRIL